jgi:amino acid adenylation domain-containing protein
MPQQPLLSGKDRYQLLYEFNDTRAEYPKDKVLQELFEEQVEKTPNNLAVIFKEKKLTYRELNERSNQLARTLRKRGVRPDQIVGLMVNDNSIEMIIGMISILKAGGAFLPIDPDFPKERIEYMVKDSNIAILLTQGKLKEEIRFESEVINLDYQSSFTGDCSNLEKINQSNDLVYVIYTSGSTGKPKGVQIEHTSIVNQIFGLEKMFTFDSSLHHILLAPITFDPSVQQIFLPLTSGGKLFLVSQSTKHNIKTLWEFIVSNRIDIVNTVPSLMNVLLDHVDGYDSLNVKYIILAGEVFSKNLYLRLKETLPAEKIINIYGPTEATINTTLYECNDEEINATVPIGKPLVNYNVLILDEHQNMVPIGAYGEICISGVGLARGYLNNPELTAEKFVANPFTPGERMYRTGDLGRWTADGNIEFLGRIDHQVKVHGIRVELGEIETVLGQHPAVQETVVIDQEDHAGIARLVAYVVPNQDQIVTIDELRLFLKEKLPDYMLPSAFLIIDALPLTPHGKVDRRALPVSEPIRQEPENTFVPPRDELEEKLTKIWEKVLGIKNIGIKDNFFDLGGTSLLAMILFSEIEKLIGKNFPLSTILDAPTVEKLARILTNEEWLAPWSPLVAIQPEGSKPPFFCVHAAGGNVLIYRDLARHLDPDQPFYGLQAQGMDGVQPFHTRIEDMAARYIKEIQTVQPEGPYFLGGYCLGGSIAYEMAQQLNSQGKKVALLVLLDTYNFSKTKPQSFIGNLHHNMERVEFHLRNFLLLKMKERITFIKEKTRVAKGRRNVWLGMIKMKMSNKVAFKNKQASYLYNLWKISDQAADNYKPKIYPGRITQFKPIREYSRYIGPELGWDGLAGGGVETHILPVYPGGMLIEPFVKFTSEKLNICIQRALKESRRK